MPIIFNGHAMVAHHNEGTSAYLLVTFLGAFHEQEAESRYLLQSFVERESITCIGISARARNLYISDELDSVVAMIRELRRPEQKLIVIGQSSGGYAALKFAGLLGADQVLAFSPIFSMDEDDLGITETMVYERAILKSAIRYHRVPVEVIQRGMRPGREDCPITPFVIYDIKNENDSYAAARLQQTLPHTEFFRVRNLGHAMLNQIETTQSSFLLSLLTALERDDHEGVKRQLFRMVRDSEEAIGQLLIKIARWRPMRIPALLQTPRVRTNFKDPHWHRMLVNIVTYELLARGFPDAAVAQQRSLYPDLFPKGGILPPAEPDRPNYFLVLSFHGHVLHYDSERGGVVLSAEPLVKSATVAALLDISGATSRFVVVTGHDMTAVVPDGRSGDGFEVVPVLDSGLVAFRRNGAFLRSDGARPPVFAATEALEWERFALIPITKPDMLSSRTPMNFFDQACLRARQDQTLPGPALAARKTAFRSVLQRFFSG